MRTGRFLLTPLVTAFLTLAVAAPAVLAATGQPSSGRAPVVAEDRTALELAAEAYALQAHNEQRAAGSTRNGATYADVDGGPALVPYTDMMTVSRWWADRMDLGTFLHNPDYGDQFGHWRSSAENIAAGTIRLPGERDPTREEVLRRTEDLMQRWWESSGHRHTWMRDDWDHLSVGASIRVTTVDTGRGPMEFWTLSLVANFRAHDGSRIDGRGFAADGTTPPNESDTTLPAPSSAASGPFADVAGDHLFARSIGAMAASGVTTGCGTGRYCPDGTVTRGQMAAFLTRALDLPAGSATFADSRGHTFERPIAALARAGITTGCGTDSFCPDTPVTRGQMAAFLERAGLLD